MAFQYGTTLRNNQLTQIQSTVGASGTLKIFSGAEPATCATADPTGLLATITLPATFMGTASAGTVAMSGTWSTTASATGTAASFRIYDGSSVCHIQGNCTSDLVLNNTSLATGQTVTVTTFSVSAANG